MHVDVVRLAIGDEQYQLARGTPLAQEKSRVAQRRAHTRRQLAGHPGEPCASPYPAELAILDEDGNLVKRVTAAADGTFQIDLPPGDYTIAPKNGDPYPTAPSQGVTVADGQYVEIQINFDSGIR